jgi:hypothetical protein
MNGGKIRAITMWDFSWLERRWSGGGYEDWDLALDELVARGYDSVRIDAYPHLLAADPHAEYRLIPVWTQHDWGSPYALTVRVHDALMEFLGKCKERGIGVGLSSWFRQDTFNHRMRIRTPQDHAAIWRRTLELIDAAGLLDTIIYLDFCNEWPISHWAPFFVNEPGAQIADWHSGASMRWMEAAIADLKPDARDIDLTFSFTRDLLNPDKLKADIGFLDFLEPHIWMTYTSDFDRQIGYVLQNFDPSGYEILAQRGPRHYRANPEKWQRALTETIDVMADWSRRTGKPLGCTECWGTVNYKDGPGLEWEWVKELCELGTRYALGTGRFAAVATSNFCGPQFVGMWRDVDWHRGMTDTIKSAAIDSDL